MNYSINRRFIVRFTVGIVVAALSAAAIVGLSEGSDHQKSSSQLRRDNRSVTATKEKAQAPTLDPTTAIAEVNEEKSSTVAAQASDGSSAKAPAAPAAAVAPVAPPAAVAPVAPPAAVAPVGDHTGPTFGGVGAGCGVKTIFSITVSDPSGVAAVWGNYYNDAGVKTGFTMGPGQNGYWVVSIFDTDLDGFDSIYVAASDSAGNTSSTRVSGLCQV
ncbi:MAG: hypothetical protein NTU68_05850 [Actinobacteria bacterium]|nr:hypothetical protein [Actinomycetota bacterium]